MDSTQRDDLRRGSRIKQSPDHGEDRDQIILNYNTVKESAFETFEKAPQNGSKFQNSASGSIIKQQRDENEEFPPHSSNKTSARGSRVGGIYRGNLMEDSTNRNH